jgi:hypothetical protein
MKVCLRKAEDRLYSVVLGSKKLSGSLRGGRDKNRNVPRTKAAAKCYRQTGNRKQGKYENGKTDTHERTTLKQQTSKCVTAVRLELQGSTGEARPGMAKEDQGQIFRTSSGPPRRQGGRGVNLHPLPKFRTCAASPQRASFVTCHT